MSERPRPPHRAYEIKDVVLDNQREGFARFDRAKPPSRASQRPGMSPLHLENIRGLPCSVCEERRGIEAHHLKSGPAASERGVSLKATDRWAVPLCGMAHHPEIERIGSKQERDWFLSRGIDPHALAQALWDARRDPVRMDFVLRAHKQSAQRQLSAVLRQEHGAVFAEVRQHRAPLSPEKQRRDDVRKTAFVTVLMRGGRLTREQAEEAYEQTKGRR
jgi:hypothetical protein